jgi:hypothetical protein
MNRNALMLRNPDTEIFGIDGSVSKSGIFFLHALPDRI